MRAPDASPVKLQEKNDLKGMDKSGGGCTFIHIGNGFQIAQIEEVNYEDKVDTGFGVSGSYPRYCSGDNERRGTMLFG